MTDQTDVTVRPLQAEDISGVAELFRQTWLEGLPREEGSLAATLVLGGYLAEHEWGVVAERGETLLGTMLAGLRLTDHSSRWEPLVRDACARARDIDPALPAKLESDTSIEAEEARITHALKASDLPEADATVQLLLLAPEARGRHLGSRLLASARDWMRSQGARGYFLMTDDECDVGFYDHLGLRRMLAQEVKAPRGGTCVYAYGELL